MSRADALIAQFGLVPHPEGGWYRRLHTSDTVLRLDRGERPAVTSIVYLLREGECSRWHRVAADELWHFYEGSALTLLRADPSLQAVSATRLGVGDNALPMIAVPADHWQAARCNGSYALVGCTVAPGFDFADFTLMQDEPPAAQRLRDRHPAYADLL